MAVDPSASATSDGYTAGRLLVSEEDLQTRIRALGWVPTREVDAGLAETVGWYRDHPEWGEPLLVGSAT